MIKRDLEKTKEPYFDYVASGLNHTFFSSVVYGESCPEMRDAFHAALKNLNGAYDHSYSALFNAWQEKRVGEQLAESKLRDAFQFVYADSGGLQMMTQGAQIDAAAKKQVYELQGRLSDFGFCFDEIPVVVPTGAVGRGTLANRFFDWSNVESCAKKTGQNLHEQINHFIDQKSKCKPFLIVQGNCYDSAQKWLDTILKQVPLDKWKYFGGIASSIASIGTGHLENVERYIYLARLQGPKSLFRHIHFLGMGSVGRLLPFSVMAKNGFFPNTKRVSYDSTSHTSSITMGFYQPRGKLTTQVFRGEATTPKEDFKRAIITEVMETFDILAMGIDDTMLHLALFEPAGAYAAKYGEDDKAKYQKHICRFVTVLTQMVNFAEVLEHVNDSKDNKILESTTISEFQHIFQIKDMPSMLNWFKELKRTVSSSKIPHVVENYNLEEFF